MVLNIVIVSVLVILIIHYSIDYLKTFLNPSPPMLEDLKYKKYKTMIDEISRPRQDNISDGLAIALTVGDLEKAMLDDKDLGLDDTDLEKYFSSKIADQ
jgi:hypothetical protein